MQIPVTVEPTGTGFFRAQATPPFTASAEGKTSAEAVANLRQQLEKEVECGKQVVMVDVPAQQDNPLLAMAGWLKDDPMYDEWQAAIEEYRRQCDIDEGIFLCE